MRYASSFGRLIGNKIKSFLDLFDTPTSYSGKSGLMVKVKATEDGIEFGSGDGAGDVTGAASSVDNTIPRFNGTDGKVLQSSNITIDDSDNIDIDETTIITKDGSRFIHNFKHPTGATAIPIGDNTFLGINAGNFTMGSTATFAGQSSDNTAIGVSALFSNTKGFYNIATGNEALYSNTEGYANTAIGGEALYSNTGGYANTAIGVGALYSNTGGYANTAIGDNAGANLTNGYTPNQTSNNSLYLGSDTRVLASGDTNEIIIGASAIGLGSNSVVLGNSSITKTSLRGNVGIGTDAPNANAILDVISTTKAFMPPRMTTVQRDAIAVPTAGMIVYNSTTNVMNFYNGATWGAV